MKYISSLAVGFNMLSCSTQDCCDNVNSFPAISVVDGVSGYDLFNIENNTAYDTAQIRLIYYEENLMKDLDISFRYSDYAGRYFLYAIDALQQPSIESFLHKEGQRDFYLYLDTHVTYTVSVSINQHIRVGSVTVQETASEFYNGGLTIYQ